MLHKPLNPIEDDTEDAPWMVMGTPQFTTVHAFYGALQAELRSRVQRPFLASMLPIRYRPVLSGRVEQLAPDILVARVPDHPRSSYDVEREGVPPAFVLEIVSPESRTRDLGIKVDRYERIGVEEYVLFAPETADGRTLLTPPLRGFQFDPVGGEFVDWEPDEAGRLYSAVLDLWVVVRGGELRLQRTNGSWVLTPVEAAEAAEAREHEALARQQAEAEVARLQSELERRDRK